MRADLAHGISALGFANSLRERYKQSHAQTSRKWRSHCSAFNEVAERGQRIAKRSLYFDFEDPQSDNAVPSLNYLLRVTLEEIESHIPYYKHRMTMNGGLLLSGDHFIKIGKVVLIDHERAFVGIYSVMNEFGKILLFRLVTGTTLLEVEDSLRGLNRRYKLHGFKGPILFTTDRCYQERSFYEGKNNREEQPIFHSFIPETAEEQVAETGASDIEVQDELNAEYDEFLKLNKNPICFTTTDVAEASANDIIDICEQNNWDVVSLDSEWVRGHRSGPDVIQICTQDLTTYIFQKPFPKGLTTLLQSTAIQKVASKISADRSKLTEVGIKLEGEINLQRMAKDRGVVAAATVGLSEIFSKLFNSVIVDKDPNVRLSNWNNRNLSKVQLEYAALDAYSQMLCYLKMRGIAHVDPKVSDKPVLTQLSIGDPLLLYTPDMSAVIAEAKFVSVWKGKTIFNQVVDDRTCAKVQITNVRRPGAKVCTMNNKTFDEIGNDENEPLEIKWKLKQTHKLIQVAPSQHLNITTVKRPRKASTATIDYGEDEGTEEAIPPLELLDDDGIDDVEENEAVVEALLNQQNELTESPDRSGHTKEDILHVFLRFVRVISKKHGAFGPFMARLSDVMFIPSQNDLEFVKAALKSAGLTEDEINAKPWRYFKRRIRRSVPGPQELEAEFNRLVNLMANVLDAKTGKSLFGKKAWNLY
jgi:hypothetical protein